MKYVLPLLCIVLWANPALTAEKDGFTTLFNGKTFDLPYVRIRSAATGLAFTVDAAHFDLLHVCRRIWKDAVPDCKLQTLESCICGRFREDDISGCQIPDAYHAYVHTGSAAQMARCIKHNMLDLMTMADLMTRLPPP